MPNVVIRVGAALEADLNALFAPIEARAKRAGEAIRKAVEEGATRGGGVRTGGGGGGGGGRAADPATLELRAKLQAARDAARNELAIARDAARAKTQMQAQAAKEAGRAEMQARKESTRAALEAARQETQAGRDAARTQLQAARDAARGAAQLERDKTRTATAEAQARARAVAGAERAAAGRTRDRDAFETDVARDRAGVAAGRRGRADRIGAAASTAVSHGLSTGAGIAKDIAQGAGLNFSLSDYVGKNVEAQKLATDISNSGYMPGAQGRNGERQDPAALAKEALSVGNETGLGQLDALKGIQAFVGKTGDLEGARAVFKDLAVLSRATGTNLDDMVSAAGDVSANIGEVGGRFKTTAEKAEAISGVMKAIAGQGKLGAVEIRDLSTQMAKLASSSGSFAGDPAQTMGMLGALAQEARQRGGAASATQAATSVQGFVNTLKTPARLKAFQAAGVDVYNGKTGLLNSPQAIIEQSLQKTKGDPVALKKMFANTSGARAVEGFANVYRQAGGGDAGMAAVRAEFDRLTKASMGLGEVQQSFQQSMKNTDAQVNIANNKMQEMTGTLQDRVVPQLLSFGPSVTKGLEWATSSGSNAVAAGVAVMFAKSAGSTIIEAAVSKLVSAVAMAPGPFALLTGAVIGSYYAINALDDYLEKSGYKAKYDKVNNGTVTTDSSGNIVSSNPDAAKVIGALGDAGLPGATATGSTNSERRNRGYLNPNGGLVDQPLDLAPAYGPPTAGQVGAMPSLALQPFAPMGPAAAPAVDESKAQLDELIGAVKAQTEATKQTNAALGKPLDVKPVGWPPVLAPQAGRTGAAAP